ncbi:MAG TPA: DoxX family protein [Parafilimonas sp.]|nr:DoxX family protein [Parafilimonas sp.]
MSTKTINIIYWIATIIFAGLMLFATYGGFKPTEQTIKIFHDGLGYPIYFIQFISYAKFIGIIAILISGLNRTVKEWAYAGLFFDLTGAFYSGIAAAPKFDPAVLGMFIWIIPGIVSYIFWHKKIQH